MAIPYVQSIDMNDFQVQNFVVHSAGSAPTNASTLGGMMWWDSGTYDIKVYNDNDSLWNSLIQGPAATTNAYVPVWDGTIGNKLSTGYSVVTTVGSPGVDTALVTDQGIREAINAAISGGVTYQGAYNAATNSPDLEAGTSVLTGYMYTVTVAGDFFTEAVDVGDVLIAETDAPTTLAEWTIVNRNIAETFLELTDTPAAFTASGGFMVMVDSTPDALEFIDPSGYNLSNFNNNLYTASALTRVNDTNVTLTLGGTPATALLQATSLTLGWTGTLADGRIASAATWNAKQDAITDGSGLTFSGTTLNLDINSLSVETTIADGDFIPFWDITATATNKKLTYANLVTALEGSMDLTQYTFQQSLTETTGTVNLVNDSASPGNSYYYGTSGAGAKGWFNSLALTSLASWADGSIIIGGAADWTTLVAGTAGYVLTMGAARPEWSPAGAPSAHALLGTAHSDTATDTVTRGSLVYGSAAPLWDELVIGGATTFLYSDGTDVSWKDVDFADLGTTPTTFSGYGISDTMANFDSAISDGNVAWATGAFHDGFSDYVGNEHIDHTAVTITAGNGLSYSSGGTDISASATIDLNINSLSTETTIADGDFLPFWDITVTATNKKLTFSNLKTQIEAGLDASGYTTTVSGDVATGATPTITHNFNLTEFTDLIVQLWRQSDNKLVGVEITAATKDTLTVNFGSAAINPALGTFRYTVSAVQE